MKLLLLGDFGGVFPDKLFEKIRKEQFDAVLCMGDFGDTHYLRELFLNYGNKITEHVTEEESIRVYNEGIEKARKVFEKLNKLGRIVYLVSGNNEFKCYEKFVSIVKEYKNLKFVDNQKLKIGEVDLIGIRYAAPSPKEEKAGITRSSMRKELKRKIVKYLKEVDSQKTILLNHMPPLNCKLDKLPKDARLSPGKHIGSALVAELVQTYKPEIVICGHLEELQGECRFARSRIINPGGSENKRYAILTIEKSLKNAKVKFKA